MSSKNNINKNDHIFGDFDAEIEIIEYGDYESVACKHFHNELLKILEDLGDRVKFIFRNFPKYSSYHYSYNAAIASEVASKYGKFWEMHNILFEHQEKMSDNYLINYAESIGISKEDFVSDFNSGLFVKKLQLDVEAGLKEEIKTSPTIFINKKRYEGELDAKSILEYIEKNL